MKGTNCNHGNIFESFPIGHWLITPGGHMPMMLWITASYSVTYDLDRSDFISVLSSVVHRNLCFLSSRMMFRWVSAHISRAFQSEVLLTFRKILGLSCQGNSTLQCLFVLFEDDYLPQFVKQINSLSLASINVMSGCSVVGCKCWGLRLAIVAGLNWTPCTGIEILYLVPACNLWGKVLRQFCYF